ncbi:MAG: DNA polymerase/3'-5' exonuclease PolX [Candidatus Omnitrophica bacterium]|nr:DNA polymerase/3'-5' exonuclease PolX [Candidatus Omnitrophota bacterium]
MDKKEVAEVLEEIGTLLELKNENPFKIRAYTNASRIIDGLSEDLQTLVKEKKLQEIKGIGAGLSEKITELVTTGKSKYYEELKKGLPSGLLDMLNISGVGPKKAKKLYEELGIKSLGELEYACKENRLLDLEGFGERSQRKILEGIQFLKKHEEYHLYPEAFEAAARVLEALKKEKKIKQMSIAGSLRRKKETIRDIDFVVAAEEHESVMERFTSLPDIETVQQKGETKASVLLRSGIQADLRVVTHKEFPYALHHFTGSKEHNIAMRSRAQRMGYKMNEYGLFRGNRLVPCKDEEGIFKKLGLTYIPPEMREDNGEVEAAEKRKLPSLVQPKEIQGVFHVHSTYSDGAATLEEVAKEALKLGYTYIGISDHSQSARYAHGLEPERLKKQQKEIDGLNEKYKGKLLLLKGSEVDILADGTLDYSEKNLKTFDFVIASVHTHFTMSEKEMTRRVIKAIQNPYVTMLGHPTGRLLLSREPYAIDLPQVIDVAKKHGVIIELNANPHRLDLDWRFCKLAKEKGVLLSINPDAHQSRALSDTDIGVGIAQKGWLSPSDIFNTLPLPKILAHLKRKSRKV